jgi:hypothetical protein
MYSTSRVKFLLSIWILVPISLLGQESDYKNSIYLEVGGTAHIYSLNYDRSIILSQKFKLIPRVGFATLFKNEPYIIPFELTGSLGKYKNYFEFGVGYTLTNNNNFLSYRVGYRREQNKNLFRAGLIYFPGLTWDEKQGYPWLGLSYGYRFNFNSSH